MMFFYCMAKQQHVICVLAYFLLFNNKKGGMRYGIHRLL